MTVSIYGMLIGSKLYTLRLGDAVEQVSQLESNRTMNSEFSFVSVDALTKVTVAHYLTALRTHLRVVEQRSQVLHGEIEFDTIGKKAVEGDTVSRARTHSSAVSGNVYAHQQIAPVRREVLSFVYHRQQSIVSTPVTALPGRTISTSHETSDSTTE